MNKLIPIVLMLVCCGGNDQFQPDALTVDAVIDAIRADALENRGGCAMGLLPGARTLTINTGDPVPPALLNELQDMHTGDRRSSFSRTIFPPCWLGSVTVPVLVLAPGSGAFVPVWQIPSAPSGQTLVAHLPFEGHDIVDSVSIDVYGDGAIDWLGNIASFTSMTDAFGVSVASNGGGVTNQAATWTNSALTVVTAGSANLLPVGGILRVNVNTTGAGVIHLGPVHMTVRR